MNGVVLLLGVLQPHLLCKPFSGESLPMLKPLLEEDADLLVWALALNSSTHSQQCA